MILTVNLPHQSYPIYIERGGLHEIKTRFHLDRKVLIVTDDGVPSEYAEAVKALCPPTANVIRSEVPVVYGGAVEAMYDVGLDCDECFKRTFLAEF